MYLSSKIGSPMIYIVLLTCWNKANSKKVNNIHHFYSTSLIFHLLTGTAVLKSGEVSNKLCFLHHGRVDIIQSLHKKRTITTIQPYDYFGETGILNYRKRAIQGKIIIYSRYIGRSLIYHNTCRFGSS